jgi:hypothetical protein
MSTQTPGARPPATGQGGKGGLSPNARFWLSMAASQATSNGQMLQDLDEDTTGADDIAGLLTKEAGLALRAYLKGDLNKWESYLKLIADGIYTELGLMPPEPAPQG